MEKKLTVTQVDNGWIVELRPGRFDSEQRVFQGLADVLACVLADWGYEWKISVGGREGDERATLTLEVPLP